MSLRKTNISSSTQQQRPAAVPTPSSRIESGYGNVHDDEEEDKYKAYADQQNAKIWTYIIIITLCTIVWISALTSWVLLRKNGYSGHDKDSINKAAHAELAAATSPLQSQIRQLKEELVKEEKAEAKLLGKYEKLEKFTNELREAEKHLWTEENNRWGRISPELRQKFSNKLPPALSHQAGHPFPLRLPNIPSVVLPPGMNQAHNHKNTQLGNNDPNARAKEFETISKGKSKLSPLGKKIKKLNIKDQLLGAKTDEEIEEAVLPIVEKMTVPELIGSILVVGISTYEYTKELDQCIRNGKIGGVFIHRDMTPKSRKKSTVRKYTDWLNARASLALGEHFPLIIASDDEGGHYNNYPYAFQEWPNNLGLAAVNDTIAAHQFGLAYGKELKSVGINVVLGPCMDVNIEPKNPVIGLRSFGSTPSAVGKLGSAVVQGFLDAGIVPTLKHFPGHGRTNMDSHISLPTIKAKRESLERIELPPFQTGIHSGALMVMSGHLVVPELEKEKQNWPATFSTSILKDLLREKMGFKGVIITDSLSMQGAKKAADNDDAKTFYNSLMAGNDLLMDSTSLHCGQGQWDKVNKFLIGKANANKVVLDRLKDAAKRVLSLRLKLRNKSANRQVVDKTDGGANSNTLVRSLHRQAITILKDGNKILPLQTRLQEGKKVVVIIPNSINVEATESRFGNGKATVLHFSQVVTCMERRHIIDALREADTIILAVHDYNISPQVLMHGVYKEQKELAYKIYNMQQKKDITQDILFISIENPYDLIEMPPFKSVVVGFGSGKNAVTALWDMLFTSKISFKSLPVELPITTEEMIMNKRVVLPPSRDSECSQKLAQSGVPIALSSSVKPTAGLPGEIYIHIECYEIL
eukprot:g4243.t1